MRKEYSEEAINRKDMIKFIFSNTKSVKGSEYTIQKAFRILKNYEYITRNQPDNLIIRDPRPESFAYILYRHFGAGENPAPTIEEILTNKYILASNMSQEGILKVIDEMENEWWFREKTHRSDSLTLRFYDAMEFVNYL
jgi:hypothetical protein